MSAARSGAMKMKAPPASEISQQSSMFSGSEIGFDVSTTSMLISIFICAFGCLSTWLGVLTQTAAISAHLMPYFYMYACATNAYGDGMTPHRAPRNKDALPLPTPRPHRCATIQSPGSHRSRPAPRRPDLCSPPAPLGSASQMEGPRRRSVRRHSAA